MVSVTDAYLVLILGSAPFTLAALYHVLNNLHRRGSRPLVAILVGTLVWGMSALVVEIAPSFQVGLYANRVQYFGIVAVPTAFLVFALIYANREYLVSKLSVGLLSLEPIAVIALVWTDSQHDLWTSGGIVGSGETYVVDGAQATCNAVICFGDSGIGFFAHTVYSYSILLVGAVLVLSRPIRSSDVPRGQAVSMAVAVGAPLAANVLSLFVLPTGFPDLTPVAFGVSGVAIVVGLYRYSLVETDALMEVAAVPERDDGAVLLEEGRVSELNVEAAKVLAVDADSVVGAPVDDAFAGQEQLLEGHRDDPATVAGETLTDPITGETYLVSVEQVSPDAAPKTGWVYEFSQAE
jgi:hypothetical protein